MRIGLISDVHGNLFSLDSVLAELARQQVDAILCAGDMIGYYPFTNQVIECLRSKNITAIQGNHEGYLLGHLPVSTERMQGCRLDIVDQEITRQNREWLANLPSEYQFEMDGLQFLLCHGSPWSPEEYIYPNSAGMERFTQLDADAVIMGHTHIPWQSQVDDKWLINPGSCGQPRDYQPTASYAILDTKKRRVALYRTGYDLSNLIATLHSQNYPQPLIDILCRTK